MRCDNCKHWVTSRQTIYEDESVITTYSTPANKGLCGVLNLITALDFGCTSFIAGNVHIITTHKAGAPWQHSHAGPCPVCNKAGSTAGGACDRCAGTGFVRHYDDGYIGEEQTRLHPKEKELRDKGEPLPEPNPGTTLAPVQPRKAGIMESGAL